MLFCMVDWQNVFHLAVNIKQSDIQGREGSGHDVLLSLKVRKGVEPASSFRSWLLGSRLLTSYET